MTIEYGVQGSHSYLAVHSCMSSAIASIDYNEDTRVLTVSFAKGGSHVYPNVDPETVAEFRAASSQGQFFNAVIRPLAPGRR